MIFIVNLNASEFAFKKINLFKFIVTSKLVKSKL
jgi:hypothetical protein